jgi:hypothetical protein
LSWVSPTGHNDPDNEWTNEPNIYDEDEASYATDTIPSGAWGSFVELTHVALTSNKVRYKAGGVFPGRIDQVDLDVYKDGAWVNVYEGTDLDINNFIEKTFTEGSVTKARLRFHNAWGIAYNVQFREFDFWEVSAPTGVGRRLLVGVGRLMKNVILEVVGKPLLASPVFSQ